MSTIGHNRRSLAPRAVRMRNACVRHAARSLGLPVPDSAALRALPDDASLRDALSWWRTRVTGVSARAAAAETAGMRLLRFAWMTTVMLLGLAFSYGRVQ